MHFGSTFILQLFFLVCILESTHVLDGKSKSLRWLTKKYNLKTPKVIFRFSSASPLELGLVALSDGQVQQDLLRSSWDGIGAHIAV